MQIDYLTRALLAGLGIALIAGPIGSIMVWRRLSYFGDTLAHSTLLGVCFTYLLNVNIYLGLIIMCSLVTCSLMLFLSRSALASDTVLGILSHSTLALGLILASNIPGMRTDISSYLYGDILAIRLDEVIGIYILAALVMMTLIKIWRPTLSISVHEDLAVVEGVAVGQIKFVLMLLIAVVFAVAMKLVGALLITALVIIPASCARQMARNPESMAVIGSVVAMLAVGGGLFCSSIYDWPAGPGIICVATSFFVTVFVIKKIYLYFRS